jgi:outer membrane protein TolC
MSKRLLALISIALLCQASDPFSVGGYLRNRFHPQIVQEHDVEGLEAHIVDGKLVLTVESFLELLLKNSTDIHITQLDVYLSAYAITAAKAPFDPQLLLSFSSTRTAQPEPNQISGAQTLESLSQNSQVAYSQVLGAGPTVSASYNANRTSSNSAFNVFNPDISDSLNFQAVQPLLQGRGNLQIRTPLLIAKTQLSITSKQSQTTIANTMANAAVQYWEAVRARDNIRVQQQSLELAQKSYEHDKLALELGALSRLDIFQSESQVAQRRLSLIQSQYAYREQRDGLRRLIGADLKPATRSMEIVLQDDPSVQQALLTRQTVAQTIDEAIATALRERPELNAANQRISIDDLNEKAARNALLPRLDLSVNVGSAGLAGVQLASTGLLGTAAIPISSNGLGDSLRQLLGFNSPYYGAGLTLSLPFKASAARASLADALVNRTRDNYTVRQLQQQIILEVKTTANELELARESVNAAVVARDLAKHNVDAEQQKYELGTVTAFELLSAQTSLATAESSVVDANISFQKALISYGRATWAAPYGGLEAVVRIPKQP